MLGGKASYGRAWLDSDIVGRWCGKLVSEDVKYLRLFVTESTSVMVI